MIPRAKFGPSACVGLHMEKKPLGLAQNRASLPVFADDFLARSSGEETGTSGKMDNFELRRRWNPFVDAAENLTT